MKKYFKSLSHLMSIFMHICPQTLMQENFPFSNEPICIFQSIEAKRSRDTFTHNTWFYKTWYYHTSFDNLWLLHPLNFCRSSDNVTLSCLISSIYWFCLICIKSSKRFSSMRGFSFPFKNVTFYPWNCTSSSLESSCKLHQD